jgi:hypothetical protein
MNQNGTFFREVRRRADELIGSPKELAQRMLDLRTAPASEIRLDGRRRSLEWEATRLRLAIEFGRLHGWHLGVCFSAPTLARRAVLPRRREPAWHNPRTIEHPYYYRAARRATGLACHLYPRENLGPELIAWAEANRLVVSFPDFPSWQLPGWTVLVLYQPVRPA